MKIGTINQQKRPDKMKRPRFLTCEEVPLQIVSSAMAQVLSDCERRASIETSSSSFSSCTWIRDCLGSFASPILFDHFPRAVQLKDRCVSKCNLGTRRRRAGVTVAHWPASDRRAHYDK